MFLREKEQRQKNRKTLGIPRPTRQFSPGNCTLTDWRAAIVRVEATRADHRHVARLISRRGRLSFPFPPPLSPVVGSFDRQLKLKIAGFLSVSFSLFFFLVFLVLFFIGFLETGIGVEPRQSLVHFNVPGLDVALAGMKNSNADGNQSLKPVTSGATLQPRNRICQIHRARIRACARARFMHFNLPPVSFHL